ncbi:MAG: zinc-binding dehydrogenase [Saprospiraceae bacterium]|nr:zinc-binding dehydrogenase [Saprospiraceae bacterium]
MLIKGGILKSIHENIEYEAVDISPQDEEVIVDIKASALNRRDLWIQEGKYAKIKLPCILGSDGAGEYHGEKVVIYPAFRWGIDPTHQSNEFEVLGMPHHGCFADKVAIPPSNLFAIPPHLTFAEAAAFPLSGLTAWRAIMTQGKAQKGQKILISGVGGGVASFVLQFAIAHDMEVYVTSGTPEKIKKSIELGATGGVNYKDIDAFEQLKKMAGGFDVVIDSAGGPDFHQFVKLCNPGATIVFYGGTLGNIDNLSPQIIFWKQLTIKGSTMGTMEEFSAMLDFISHHKIVPLIDQVFPLSEVNQAFEYMKKGSHFGKIVLEHL